LLVLNALAGENYFKTADNKVTITQNIERTTSRRHKKLEPKS
jgi:hypothetical protein